MKVTKDRFLEVLSLDKDFEIINSDIRKPDDDTVIFAKWKGQALFITFNDKKMPTEINNNDDVNASVAYDFAVSLVEIAKKPLSTAEPLVKYKIANYTNVKSDYGSVVTYREGLDIFTIEIKHNAFYRSKSANDIVVSFISMVLSGVVTAQLLREHIKEYKDSPEKFLKDCMEL